MLHVGLTGGIASGKSTVAAILRELGAVVLDADAIAREVVEAGTPGLATVVSTFGQQLLRPDGSLDRAALAGLVFDDAEALRTLNAIVHPLVREETAARVARLPQEGIVVHDVPLIVENRMSDQYHLVIVVAASEAVRLQRAVARGLTEPEATARIAAQADDVARHRAADVWVENEGTEDDLRSAVELVWHDRIVPFAENLRTGRWAEPVEAPDGARPHRAMPEAADRLIARLARAAGAALTDLRHVSGTDEPSTAVVEIRGNAAAADLPARTLLDAGFVKVRDRVFANADPGRPAVLRLEPPDARGLRRARRSA